MNISVVIPAYNESENLNQLVPKIFEELESIPIFNYEVIVVDDGSEDDTSEVMSKLKKNLVKLKFISYPNNKGQSYALNLGIKESKFEYIITMDADLQNDPKDFSKLIENLNLGIDCVCGWRKYRKDNYWTRILFSSIANLIISKVSKLKIHDFGCTFRIYRAEVIKSIPIYGETHRFVPAYLKLYGFNVIEVPINHNPRKYGVSHYGLARIHKVILDILVLYVHFRYREKPIHLFGGIGLSSVFVGLSLFLISMILKLIGTRDFVETPIPLLGSLFFLSGVFILLLGVKAELDLFQDKKNQKL